jgi:hypothetical protein
LPQPLLDPTVRVLHLRHLGRRVVIIRVQAEEIEARTQAIFQLLAFGCVIEVDEHITAAGGQQTSLQV